MRSSSPLRTSLIKRRSALAKHLSKALTGDSHAVHQARVASRRLRETLPIVGVDLDGSKAGKGAKKTLRRMRRVTRALGPVRELEVTLGMIAPPTPPEPESESDSGAAPAAKRDPTAPGREHVAAMLRRDLEKARERLIGELDAGKIEGWLEQMEAIEEAIGEAIEPRTKWRAELADRLETRAGNLKKALDDAGVLFDSERLHQVRIALKRLRYAMELAGELRVASTAAAVRELKAVQDTLGTLHDHDVLMDYTNSAAAQPGLTRPTRASLTALNASLDRTRHELHAQFLAARPSLDRVHDRAIDVAARARAKAKAPARPPERNPNPLTTHARPRRAAGRLRRRGFASR
jgi:CHAD domain-containing protein